MGPYREFRMKALNYPKVILPTHWDNFERPYSEGPHDLRDVFGDPGNMDLAVKEVKQVSPKSKVVMLTNELGTICPIRATLAEAWSRLDPRFAVTPHPS